MPIRFPLALIGLVLAASACTMTAPGQPLPACIVHGASLLPAATGGEQALCDAIGAVLAERPGSRAEVRVVSKSRMTAVLVLPDGRELPSINTVVSDSTLSARSVRMLADAMRAQLQSIGS